MPVLALNHTQCTKIQCPALCSILSKMHLKHNTSRAVIFSPTKYGGLDLPDQYISNGISQLQLLLLGYVRLQDKTANFILIDTSYLQLLSGSSTLFFNLSFPSYSHSTDGGWLVSTWQFLYTIKLTIFVKQTFVPITPREGDIALMDYFISQCMKPKLLCTFRSSSCLTFAVLMGEQYSHQLVVATGSLINKPTNHAWLAPPALTSSCIMATLGCSPTESGGHQSAQDCTG